MALCFVSGGLAARFQLPDVIRAVGYFSIPLYFMTCPRRCLPRNLAHPLALLWLVHVAHGVQQLGVGAEVVGIAGNRNWMAALTAALVPWVWLSIARLPVFCGRPRLRRIALAATVVLSMVLALTLCYYGRSRGVWLLVVIYGVFVIGIGRLSSVKMRIALVLALSVLIAAVIMRYPDYFGRTVEEDIRLPLWRQTAQLVLDHPWLGVGPGNFRREFPLYRSPEHTRRRVAGAVTEHPHNQVLYIGAILGVPLAVLWCLLLLPLVRQPMRGAFWRGLHFSAFLLVFHGFVDKTLVQPPTSLLGFIFLGLLWRRHMSCRLGVPWPHRTLRWCTAIVAWLFVGSGMYWGGQQIVADWFYRKGMILKASREPARAYKAFVYAAEINPRMLRAHAYAGRLAAESLAKPVAALQHFSMVYRQEPFFGHINAEIAIVLGNMGRHRASLPFFARQADLYPYDSVAQYRLLRAKILVGDRSDLARVVSRLREAQWHTLSLAYGQDTAGTMLDSWRRAVAHGDLATALRRAQDLILPFVGISPTEPGFKGITYPNRPDGPDCSWRFDAVDAAMWTYRNRCFRFAVSCRESDVEGLARVFAECLENSRGGEETRESALDFTVHPAYTFAEILWQAGYNAAVVTQRAQNSTGIVEVRHGRRVWLVDVLTGNTLPGRGFAQLQNDAELQQNFGLLPDAGGELQLILPVGSREFCTKNQILGNLLSEGGQGRSVRPGESPRLRLWRYDALAVAGASGNRVSKVSLGRSPVLE